MKWIYKGSFKGIYKGSFKGIHKGSFKGIYKGSFEGIHNRLNWDLAFFWLALRTLIFLGFYMNHNMEAKSLTFWRGSEVSQGLEGY